MKTLVTATIAALLALTTGAKAQIIGVQFFNANSNGTAITPSELAGEVPQTNFNLVSTSASNQLLNDGNGDPTLTSISVNNEGYYFAGSTFTGNSGDQALLSAELNHGDLTTTSSNVQVFGITYARYDVYIYGMSDNKSGAISTFQLTTGAGLPGAFISSGSSQYLSLATGSFTGYVAGTSTYDGSGTPPSGIKAADYVEFTGLTAADLQINFGGYQSNAGMNGIQIVQDLSTPAVPEPSTWAMMLGGLGVLGFCLRRKSARL